jgi:co-chaperonin GroES (HSP10)
MSNAQNVKEKMLEVETENYQPIISDRVLVYADRDKNKRYNSENLDLIIEMINTENDVDNCVHDGVVRYVPVKHPRGLDFEVKPGDHIYCHKFLTHDDQCFVLNGEIISQVDYENHVYCKIVNDEIVPVGQWNIMEPISEEESNYITKSGIYLKSKREVDTEKAKITHPSAYMRAQGVKEGSIVFFHKNADLPVKIEGKVRYPIRDKHLIAIITE